jgi:response regulator RpfG family c-di-GMP phosphodiesterase
MKIIRGKKLTGEQRSEPPGGYPPRKRPWKLLIVDDEPDVHKLTRLNLKGFQFAGRGVELLEAESAAQARELLKAHPDIAIALIDVVMESEDAGLKLVEYIRNALEYRLMRLLIRTGQPGAAPERYVIDNYDIDGYHDKTDLTAQRLYTSVRSAIKSYCDLHTIDLNRVGLSHVLKATRDLYHFRSDSVRQFFMGVLTQIIGLFKLGDSAMIATIQGMVITIEGESIEVQAGIGAFSPEHAEDPRIREIGHICSEAVLNNLAPAGLRAGAMVIPLRVEDRPVGFVYLESAAELSRDEKDLIQIMANQCAGALENLRLHVELKDSYEHVINMLALAAEYKDHTTGEHINRIARLATEVSLELGVPAAEAEEIGKAARLHDVGKVGIPNDILQRPGALNPEEFEEVKRHTQIGAAILQQDSKLELARDIALMHHEQWGGQGYPQGLKGEEIPLPARIVSVVDVFDALTNERPYKPAWPVSEALNFIELEKGIRFDADVVEALKQVIGRS